MSQFSHFTSTITSWYTVNKRDLPWRNTKNPFHIYLSEIILQQTRVDQGIQYYYRFTDKFQTPSDLANCTEDEILRLWQGLGYYSRARNMHEAVKQMKSNFNNQVPDSYTNLLKIKGIGKYTAAAISSFAFGEKQAVLDGNVFRVLSRYFGIQDDINSSKGNKVFSDFSFEILPEKNHSIYNQGIMEFGALQCTPKPKCDSCPLYENCFAFNHQKQGELPVKIKKIKIKTRYFHYFIILKNNSIYLKKRTETDIWKGLYEPFLIESQNISDFENDLPIETFRNAQIPKISNAKLILNTKHILTHQKLFLRFFLVKTEQELTDLQDYQKTSIYDIEKLGMPIVIRNVFDDLIFD